MSLLQCSVNGGGGVLSGGYFVLFAIYGGGDSVLVVIYSGGGGFCPSCISDWGVFCPSIQKTVGGILSGGDFVRIPNCVMKYLCNI